MTITIREPGSAITHFIGMMLALIASAPLLAKAALDAGRTGIFAMAVFMTSMILLYGASALYHSVNLSGSRLKVFRKLDHMMIFVLIAGSYTPVCLLVLEPQSGHILLIAVWAIAAAGILIKALWITCPKWFSSILYIVMGWLCIFALPELWASLPTSGFMWLLMGGLMYTIGGVIYALKLPLFNSRHKNFGSHEVFHVFVMAGSFCHFMLMYLYLA